VTTGTVKKVVSDRGFGFIAAEDGKEYFFHRDGLTPSLDFERLVGGEKVQFDVEQSPKGARAKNVQSASPASRSRSQRASGFFISSDRRRGMAKHSKFENARRAAETTRAKEIEAAWLGRL